MIRIIRRTRRRRKNEEHHAEDNVHTPITMDSMDLSWRWALRLKLQIEPLPPYCWMAVLQLGVILSGVVTWLAAGCWCFFGRPLQFFLWDITEIREFRKTITLAGGYWSLRHRGSFLRTFQKDDRNRKTNRTVSGWVFFSVNICTFLSYPIILARTIPPNAEFFSWLLQSMIEYKEHLEVEYTGQLVFFYHGESEPCFGGGSSPLHALVWGYGFSGYSYAISWGDASAVQARDNWRKYMFASV